MKILITGGTGSLGQALIAHWKDEHDLTILSRNPHNQQAVQEKFSLEPSVFVLADICDYEAVKQACIGQDVLIHAAALKIVSQGEQFPDEYHRVNAVGSQVVVRAWEDTHLTPGKNWRHPQLPRKALYINSDKAVAPINFYGCSKRIGESFFIQRGFSSIRYGNVVESEGSFIHKWKTLVDKGRPIPVRFPHPTRFFVSMAQAVGLVNSVLNNIDEHGNGIYVSPNLSSFDIYEAARAYTDDVNICQRMLEPGEKQHEVLLQPGEVAEAVGPVLAKVETGWGDIEAYFSSETTSKISGDEVLKRLGVSPRQGVFT
jgi:FlaA1/EpsC-like NDP-sugar epimerase